MTPTVSSHSELSILFQRLFAPELVAQLAREAGFVLRQRKLNPLLFALALTVASLSKQRKSYKQVVADMHSVGGESIQPQSLQERMSLPAAEFLQALLRKPLEQLAQRCAPAGAAVPDWVRHFGGVWATDSTVMRLPKELAPWFPPGGGQPGSAALKLHLSLDVLQGKLQGFRFTPGSTSDRLPTEALSHPAGLLHLLDRGFGKSRALLGQISQAQDFFITPLWLPTPLYDEQGHKLDVEQFTEVCQASGRLDTFVYLGNPRGPEAAGALRVRLLGVRLPAELANSRRRRVRQQAKRRGTQVQQRTLRLLDWIFLVTNVPKSKMTLDQVLLSYRLRWQVELMFKRWKHIYGMRAPGYKKVESLYCHLIAALLAASLMSLIQGVMFQTWDPQRDAEPSPWALVALFVGQSTLWLLALGGPGDPVFRRQMLERLLDGVFQLGRMNKRQRLSTRRSLLIQNSRRASS